MKRYENKPNAPVFAVAAVLLSASVLTAGVYLPARSASHAFVDAQRIEMSIEPSRIDVVGVRSARSASSAHVSEARTPDA